MTDDAVQSTSRSFAFGPFTLVPERQLLLRGDDPVRIGGRALDILTALVEQPGEAVSKHALMLRVWPTTVVDEGSLKVNVAALRRTLGDGGPGDARYIATVTGGGYRFIARVTASDSAGLALSSDVAATRRHNLPTGTTRIVGRAEVIASIRRGLEETRLVSIVGPGGIGKTTVAVAVAEQALGVFKHGVWLVDLALLKDKDLTAHAIATAIGVGVHSEDMLGPLCEYLREREVLLVMDNCEHIIDAAASCAGQILAHAASVRILVTSREPLLMKGEHVCRLPGLGTPPSSDGLSAQEALRFAAIQLFVERATDRFESFTLSDAEAPAVAEICRRLDGLALAIEFAATRIDAFGVGGLLKQLDDRFRLLIGLRAGPERHRTLAATLDWSYSLLSDNEAALLRAVSVFAGVFDITGASALAHVPPEEAARTLAQLAAKSLLATDLDADGIAYRLLETTRTYGLERLRISGEGLRVRQRHADHICTVLERAAGEWALRPAPEWGAAYARVLDDLRAALAWAGEDASTRHLRIRLTVAGSLLWNHFSLTEECRIHVSKAVEELDAAGLAGTACELSLQVSLAGAIMFTRGIVPQVIDASRRALDIAVRMGDTEHHLRCLRMIGLYELFVGEHQAAIRTLETFSAVAAAKDPSAMLEGDTHLACAEMFVGRLHTARRRLERRDEKGPRDVNDARFVRFLYSKNVDVLSVLSHAQWLTGAPDTAARTVELAVEYARDAKHELSLANALAWACPIFFWSGLYEKCAHAIAMFEDQVRRHSIATWRPVALMYRAALACAQQEVPSDAVEDLRRAVAELRSIHHWARMPLYLGYLADALARHGLLVEATVTVQDALALADAQDERWCAPELMRIRAAMLSTEGQTDEAQALLVQSMALSRDIGASSWRLRAANDLARLWRARSRADDAREMLLPLFNEFTEGFATRDLVTAAGLLAPLHVP